MNKHVQLKSIGILFTLIIVPFFSMDASTSPYQPTPVMQVAINKPYDDLFMYHMLRVAPVSLRKVISMLRKPDLQEYWPVSILLEGPPGVGKSTYARIIAQITGRVHLFISAATICNEYQNSGAQNLVRIFQEAKQAVAQGVQVAIVLDELNALADKSDKKQPKDESASIALWTLLDECASEKNILVIGTTNDATKMHDQLKRRFERKIIRIEKCIDYDFRRSIMIYYMVKHRCMLNKREMNEMIYATQDLEPRALSQIFDEATVLCACRNGARSIVEIEDLRAALVEYHKGTSITQAINYKEKIDECLDYGTKIVSIASGIYNMVHAYQGHQLALLQAETAIASMEGQKAGMEQAKASHIQQKQIAAEQLSEQRFARNISMGGMLGGAAGTIVGGIWVYSAGSAAAAATTAATVAGTAGISAATAAAIGAAAVAVAPFAAGGAILGGLGVLGYYWING